MATEILKEPKKRGSAAWWLWLAIAFPILVFIFWLIYRAIWTLSAMKYISALQKINVFKQNNIQVATQWGIKGTQFQEAYYGGLGWNAATQKPTGPGWLKSFFYGLFFWFALPYILLSPGFYGGLFWNKNAPQNFS